MDILIAHVHTYDELRVWKDIQAKENTWPYTPEIKLTYTYAPVSNSINSPV